MMFLPLLLLSYEKNSKIYVITYILFWNVVRKIVDTIVYSEWGLSLDLDLHITSDWLMDSGVLSVILT